MITPSLRWPGIAMAAVLTVPLLAVVLLSAPAWLAWPFMGSDRRTAVLDFLSELVEWARVLTSPK